MIAEVFEMVHHFGPLEGLGFDAIDDREIDRVGGKRRHQQSESNKSGSAHEGIMPPRAGGFVSPSRKVARGYT